MPSMFHMLYEDLLYIDIVCRNDDPRWRLLLPAVVRGHELVLSSGGGMAQVWLRDLLSCPLQFCWERGGYLAELQSSDEESSLDPFIPNQVLWIGLTDAAEEGTFTL